MPAGKAHPVYEWSSVCEYMQDCQDGARLASLLAVATRRQFRDASDPGSPVGAALPRIATDRGNPVDYMSVYYVEADQEIAGLTRSAKLSTAISTKAANLSCM
jgi:hypothetical protein